MIISESEKNRIKKLHKKYFIIKENALGGMASVGSGFVNPQGGTGRVGQFLARQAELGEDCGGSHDPMEDNVIQRFEEPPMEENLAGRFYDFGEEELGEEDDKSEKNGFKESFASARKAGKKTFEYKGKTYTTKTAEEQTPGKVDQERPEEPEAPLQPSPSAPLGSTP